MLGLQQKSISYTESELGLFLISLKSNPYRSTSDNNFTCALLLHCTFKFILLLLLLLSLLSLLLSLLFTLFYFVKSVTQRGHGSSPDCSQDNYLLVDRIN